MRCYAEMELELAPRRQLVRYARCWTSEIDITLPSLFSLVKNEYIFHPLFLLFLSYYVYSEPRNDRIHFKTANIRKHIRSSVIFFVCTFEFDSFFICIYLHVSICSLVRHTRFFTTKTRKSNKFLNHSKVYLPIHFMLHIVFKSSIILWQTNCVKIHLLV